MAISALTSRKLLEAGRIKPSHEVIKVEAGFPTRVAPIVQVRLDRPEALRVVAGMAGSDELMANNRFRGTYPGFTEARPAHENKLIRNFCQS